MLTEQIVHTRQLCGNYRVFVVTGVLTTLSRIDLHSTRVFIIVSLESQTVFGSQVTTSGATGTFKATAKGW